MEACSGFMLPWRGVVYNKDIVGSCLFGAAGDVEEAQEAGGEDD